MRESSPQIAKAMTWSVSSILTDDFWQWPDVKPGTREEAGREHCLIVNLRSPSEAKTNYSLIRAWISEEKAVPMRLLKFNRQGHAEREFLVQKIVQNQKFWFPTVTIIQKARRYPADDVRNFTRRRRGGAAFGFLAGRNQEERGG